MKTSILSFIVVLTIAFTSCQNFEGITQSDLTDDYVLKSAQIAVNDMATESVAEEAMYQAEFFAESEKLLRQIAHIKGPKNLLGGDNPRYLAGECPNVSIDSAETGYPIVITLDYGDGTELNNGRVISGIITIDISAPKGTDGATRTITYTNCVIDGIGVDGVTSQTFNGDNVTSRTISTSSDVTFVMTDGTVIDRVGSHVREWIQGIDTPMEHSDDMIEISGSVDVSSSTGDVWSRVIIEPIIKLGNCQYNVQGVVQISLNDETSVIDFGTGECDNMATLTVNGETIEIELGSGMPKAKVENRIKTAKGNRNGK